MHRDLSHWETPYKHILQYEKQHVLKFSPFSRAILEINTPRDFNILNKIYDNSVLLGEECEKWDIEYSAEFHMTNNSSIFPPVQWWMEKGYRPDEYFKWLPHEKSTAELKYRGNLIGKSGDAALPLYEGRMIGQFDFSEKGWVSGKGRSAVWRDIPWEEKKIEPQYLMSETEFENKQRPHKKFKVGIMDVTSATNTRTTIASIIYNSPCGHKVPIIVPRIYSYENVLEITGLFNSFLFDYLVRFKLGGNSLIWAVLEEIPLKKTFLENKESVFLQSLKLAICDVLFSEIWYSLSKEHPDLLKDHWKRQMAITPHERLRIRCILDSTIAELFGLSYEDLSWILRECAHPQEDIRSDSSEFNPKGFWRVDKTKDPELRHTVLTLKAFFDLKQMGLDSFLALNNGNGWNIPETISYEMTSDGTLLFDTSESIERIVIERLGPRYHDWQVEGSVEDSWNECEQHAKNILGSDNFKELINNLENKQKDTELNKIKETEKGQLKLWDY